MSSIRPGWVLALGLVAGACGARSKPEQPPSEEQRILRKVEGYLTCHNDHSELVFRLEDLYRQRFASAAPQPTDIVVLPTLSDPQPCVTAIAMATAMVPPLPALDAAGTGYGAALSRIHVLVTGYAPAKAAALHPELLAAFDAFDQAQAALFDQIYVYNRTAHLAQFEERKRKDGPTPGILVESAQLRSEDLVRFAATPAMQLDKLDVNALVASLALLERTIEELKSFDAANPEVSPARAAFNEVVDHAVRVAVAARQLAHRARGNVGYSDSEKLMIAAGNEASVVGSPAALAFAYNRLIELR